MSLGTTGAGRSPVQIEGLSAEALALDRRVTVRQAEQLLADVTGSHLPAALRALTAYDTGSYGVRDSFTAEKDLACLLVMTGFYGPGAGGGKAEGVCKCNGAAIARLNKNGLKGPGTGSKRENLFAVSPLLRLHKGDAVQLSLDVNDNGAGLVLMEV